MNPFEKTLNLFEGKRHKYGITSRAVIGGYMCHIKTKHAALDYEQNDPTKKLFWYPTIPSPLEGTDTYTWDGLHTDKSPYFDTVPEAIDWMENHDVRFSAAFITTK